MDIEAANRSLFIALNAPAGLSGSHLLLAVAAAKASIVPMALVIGWRWIAGTPADRRMLVQVLLAALPALAANYALGMAFPHPRPFMVGLGHTYLAHAPEPSFPSDHATLMWTVSLGLLWAQPIRAWGWLCALLSALTGWARVYLGVHFPLDIAGSLVVAALAVAAMVPLRRVVARLVAQPVEPGGT